MKRYKITHYQTFMGKTIEGSLNVTVNSEEELQEIIRNVYSDPHVFHVTYEEIQ